MLLFYVYFVTFYLYKPYKRKMKKNWTLRSIVDSYFNIRETQLVGVDENLHINGKRVRMHILQVFPVAPKGKLYV